jgi:hypothetical protein
LNNIYPTHTEISDILIVILYVNFFHSMELIITVSKTRSHWTSHSFVHSIYCHRINDRLWLKETSAGLCSGYTQWVWNSWEYEKVWEKAKKLIHEDTTNIKPRQKNRDIHTKTDRQADTHTHTDTNTHTHENPACIQGILNLTCNSWNPGGKLMRGPFQLLRKDQT